MPRMAPVPAGVSIMTLMSVMVVGVALHRLVIEIMRVVEVAVVDGRRVTVRGSVVNGTPEVFMPPRGAVPGWGGEG